MCTILLREKDSFEASCSRVVPTVPEIEKKLVTSLFPLNLFQDRQDLPISITSTITNSASWSWCFSEFQLYSYHYLQVSPKFGASEPQLPLSDMPTVRIILSANSWTAYMHCI